jgi:hypothetical protein
MALDSTTAVGEYVASIVVAAAAGTLPSKFAAVGAENAFAGPPTTAVGALNNRGHHNRFGACNGAALGWGGHGLG